MVDVISSHYYYSHYHPLSSLHPTRTPTVWLLTELLSPPPFPCISHLVGCVGASLCVFVIVSPPCLLSPRSTINGSFGGRKLFNLTKAFVYKNSTLVPSTLFRPQPFPHVTPFNTLMTSPSVAKQLLVTSVAVCDCPGSKISLGDRALRPRADVRS